MVSPVSLLLICVAMNSQHCRGDKLAQAQIPSVTGCLLCTLDGRLALRKSRISDCHCQQGQRKQNNWE